MAGDKTTFAIDRATKRGRKRSGKFLNRILRSMNRALMRRCHDGLSAHANPGARALVQGSPTQQAREQHVLIKLAQYDGQRLIPRHGAPCRNDGVIHAAACRPTRLHCAKRAFRLSCTTHHRGLCIRCVGSRLTRLLYLYKRASRPTCTAHCRLAGLSQAAAAAAASHTACRYVALILFAGHTLVPHAYAAYGSRS